jgi:hypothetical protein
MEVPVPNSVNASRGSRSHLRRNRRVDVCYTSPYSTLHISSMFLARSRASDDDDFVVSDSELSPVTSRRSASRASSPDASDDEDDGFIVSDEDEDAPKKKSKTKGKSGGGTSLKRPTLTKGPAVGSGGGGGGSSNNFLTAAERRAMENKDTKKSQEDPFEFLLDVRDVRKAHIHLPSKVIRLLTRVLYCRKTESDPESPSTTPGHCIFHQRHGRSSRHLKSRCVDV